MTAIQIISIVVILTIFCYEIYMSQLFITIVGESVLIGTVVGAIMGDVQTGMHMAVHLYPITALVQQLVLQSLLRQAADWM